MSLSKRDFMQVLAAASVAGMVRVGGLQYSITPAHTMGARIADMRLGGKLIEAGKSYKVAGWAPVAEAAATAGNKPVWELLEGWLKSQRGAT